MNNRYLYKAKRKDNGEWVKGFLYIRHDGTAELSHYNEYFNIERYTYEVDETTICQCTGLEDKNGKLIWENDICNCEKRGVAFFHCIVKWNQIEARFDVNAMGCNFPMTLEELTDDISIKGLDYEVISNIFDNPELLEGQV